MALPLEPLFFLPRFEEKLWGGRRLETIFGKILPPGLRIGESWELSAVKDRQTMVASGPCAGESLDGIFNRASRELAGPDANRFSRFPLLVKFIDAHDRLSIQVHPDDESARLRYAEPFGKTECWFVAEAGKKAMLGIGLNRNMTTPELHKAAETGEIKKLLRTFFVRTGEIYFIPAGTIHAIMDDVLVYEVQQNSDITLRLFDWNRLDSSGHTRRLHIEEAVAVANLSYRESYRIEPLTIKESPYLHRIRVASPYFALEEFKGGQCKIPVERRRSFRIITFFGDSAELRWDGGNRSVVKGTTVLIPAAMGRVTVHGEGTNHFLMTTIPDLQHEISEPLTKAGFSPSRIDLLRGDR